MKIKAEKKKKLMEKIKVIHCYPDDEEKMKNIMKWLKSMSNYLLKGIRKSRKIKRKKL
jgi:hypothetical protein